MKHELSGINGNIDVNTGHGAIIVPLPICKKIEEAITTAQAEKDLVEQSYVLQKFHLAKKTFSNYLSSGRIPRWAYTIAFNHSKWFYISVLLGLKVLANKLHPRNIYHSRKKAA